MRALFVHGIGVRSSGYESSVELLDRKLREHALDLTVARCFWGEQFGAKLSRDGQSVPTYGKSRGLAPVDELQATGSAVWSMLYQDPGFELAAWANSNSGESRPVPPNAAAPSRPVFQMFAALSGDATFASDIAKLGVSEPALLIDGVMKTSGFVAAQQSRAIAPENAQRALARAVAAELQRRRLEEGAPTVGAQLRDDFVRTTESHLGPQYRGIQSALAAPFVGIAKSLATWYVKRNRTSLTDLTFPLAGDVLVYQARGHLIRSFIHEELAKCGGEEVFVFAHSLGGVATVEALSQMQATNVKGLITFGSQPAYFFEVGALSTMQSDDLPPHFPTWINFFDLNDPLSFLATPIFGERVTDHEIESNEPFPASHSAYLNSVEFWTRVTELIRNA